MYTKVLRDPGKKAEARVGRGQRQEDIVVNRLRYYTTVADGYIALLGIYRPNQPFTQLNGKSRKELICASGVEEIRAETARLVIMVSADQSFEDPAREDFFAELMAFEELLERCVPGLI